MTSRVTAAVVTVSLGCALSPVAAADADYAKYSMNGTFSVVSNGEWARTNDRYQDAPSVRSTWVVSTTCSSAITCSGKVESTLGWTEDIYRQAGNQWYVKHYVPGWIPCPDGTRAPGLQVYMFYPSTDEGIVKEISDLYVGEDKTTGESGNCGRNKSLVVRLPVKVSKIA